MNNVAVSWRNYLHVRLGGDTLANSSIYIIDTIFL